MFHLLRTCLSLLAINSGCGVRAVRLLPAGPRSSDAMPSCSYCGQTFAKPLDLRVHRRSCSQADCSPTAPQLHKSALERMEELAEQKRLPLQLDAPQNSATEKADISDQWAKRIRYRLPEPKPAVAETTLMLRDTSKDISSWAYEQLGLLLPQIGYSLPSDAALMPGLTPQQRREAHIKSSLNKPGDVRCDVHVTGVASCGGVMRYNVINGKVLDTVVACLPH